MEESDVQQGNIGDKIYYHFGPDEQPNRLKTFLDFLIYFVGLLGTLLALPQLYRVWFVRNVFDMSVVPWLALAVFTPFWMLYGYVHRKKSLIMTYLLWFIVNAFIIIGIKVFG